MVQLTHRDAGSRLLKFVKNPVESVLELLHRVTVNDIHWKRFSLPIDLVRVEIAIKIAVETFQL